MDKAAKQARIDEMANALRAALSVVRPDAHLTWKSMFGGAGFFVYGKIFAAWFGEGLALKLPDDERKHLLKIAPSPPTLSPQYTEVPQAFLDDPRLLEDWVAKSVSYAIAPRKRGKGGV